MPPPCCLSPVIPAEAGIQCFGFELGLFFDPDVGANLHNPFSLVRLRQFRPLENWLCFTNVIHVRSFDGVYPERSRTGSARSIGSIRLRSGQACFFNQAPDLSSAPRVSFPRKRESRPPAIGLTVNVPAKPQRLVSFLLSPFGLLPCVCFVLPSSLSKFAVHNSTFTTWILYHIFR